MAYQKNIVDYSNYKPLPSFWNNFLRIAFIVIFAMIAFLGKILFFLILIPFFLARNAARMAMGAGAMTLMLGDEEE